MKEYIIHGTQIKNIIKILKDGYIDNNPKKKDITVIDLYLFLKLLDPLLTCQKIMQN